jgi:hypothetical protein
MSAVLLLRHVRQMCRGFGSVPVSVGGSPTAPDGRARRGLLMRPDRVIEDSMGGQALERFEELTVPTADVLTVSRGTTVVVDGQTRVVREARLDADGVVTVLELARA